MTSTVPRTMKPMPASSASVVSPMSGLATMITPAAIETTPSTAE